MSPAAYVPKSLPVYTAAYAGAISGIAAAGRSLPTPPPANLGAIVGAFAAAVDAAWDAAEDDTLALSAFQSVCAGAWINRYPTSTDPDDYAAVAQAVIGLVASAEQYFNSQGITPPAAEVAGVVMNADVSMQGVSVLQALPVGTVLVRASLLIQMPFDGNTSIDLGTTADPSAFVSAGPSMTSEAYTLDSEEIVVVDPADFLILTIRSTDASVGSCLVYYELRN